MTAWAPNTYHRPHRASTGASAVSSSTAAGCIDTSEEPDEAHVAGQILTSEAGIWPVGILKERLPPKLLGHAHSFQRAEAADALGPIAVLAFADRRPVSGYELPNAARDHSSIVLPSLVQPGSDAALKSTMSVESQS